MASWKEGWGDFKDWASGQKYKDYAEDRYQQEVSSSESKAQDQYGDFVKTAEQEQKAAQEGLSRLGEGQKFVGVGERERVMQDLQERSGAAVEGAAQRGMMHSGALLKSQQQSAMQRALASAALDTEEAQRRRQALMNVEQHVSLAKEARGNIPENVGVAAQPFEKEVERMEVRDRGINTLLTAARDQRLTRDDALRGMSQNLDAVFQESMQLRIQQAQAQGLGETDIQLMVQSMEAEKGQALQQMEGMADMLLNSDPAEAAAALQAYYTPERMQLGDDDPYNPFWSMFGGGAGAAVGGIAGFAIGGPMGAVAGARGGYQVGSGIGSLFG